MTILTYDNAKLGMAVKLLSNDTMISADIGLVGIVVHISEDNVLVRFPGWFHGHNGQIYGSGRPGDTKSYWWITYQFRALEIIEEKTRDRYVIVKDDTVVYTDLKQAQIDANILNDSLRPGMPKNMIVKVAESYVSESKCVYTTEWGKK